MKTEHHTVGRKILPLSPSFSLSLSPSLLTSARLAVLHHLIAWLDAGTEVASLRVHTSLPTLHTLTLINICKNIQKTAITSEWNYLKKRQIFSLFSPPLPLHSQWITKWIRISRTDWLSTFTSGSVASESISTLTLKAANGVSTRCSTWIITCVTSLHNTLIDIWERKKTKYSSILKVL